MLTAGVKFVSSGISNDMLAEEGHAQERLEVQVRGGSTV